MRNQIIVITLVITFLIVLAFNYRTLEKENEALREVVTMLEETVLDDKNSINTLEKSIKEKDEILHEMMEKNSDLAKKFSDFKKEVEKKEQEQKKKAQPISRGSKVSSNSEIYEITAYHAGFESTGKRKGDKGYGITASGATVQEGVTIACPPELAFGTKVKIEGVGVRVCQDRGGAIKGKILDLYIADRDKVWEWGRQKRKVEILK